MISSRRNQGFTLIELMIVMVIIGFMIGLAVVAFSNSPEKIVYKEAKRLQMIMNMAADSAMIEGLEFGLAYSRDSETNGYQLLQFNADDFTWNETESGPFKFHQLDDNVTIKLQLENDSQSEEVQARLEQLKKLNNESQLAPSILLLSSGEITPFIVTLSYGDDEAQSQVSSDGISGVTIQ